MQIVEKIDNDTLRVKFYDIPRDKFNFLLDGVKSIDGRRFHSASKSWHIPINDFAIRRLWELGFEVEYDEKNKYHREHKKIDIGIEGLYPFQNDGVAFLMEKKGRALIGDEMGTGKTIQALSYLKINPDMRPVLIVCPASIKLNWEREAHKWIGKNIADLTCIMNGGNARIYGTVVICNYDILNSNIENIIDYGFQCIIFDEVHKIKNEKAKRTKAAKRICKGVKSIIGLSGTPILNRPIEMFNFLNILQPRLFPNRWRFAQKYCGLKHNGFGWTMDGATNIEELNSLLKSTVMIRRLKKDVLKDLPQKIRSVIPFEIDHRGDYNDAKNDLINWIEKNYDKEKAEKASKVEFLVRFEYLKTLAAEGKIKSIINWIKDFLETESKLVIMATHHEIIDRLMKEFMYKAVKLDGRNNSESRQISIDAFQNDPNIQLFIGNIKAAGEGITLTAASSLAFIELGWTPGEHNQAEDRIHRIGQEESVNIYYLIAKDTIEEELAEMLDEKRKVLSAVLDGEKISDDSDSLISNLLKKYLKK